MRHEHLASAPGRGRPRPATLDDRVQRRGSDQESALLPQYAVRQRQVIQALLRTFSRHHPKALDMVAMPFPDFEARRAFPDPIPQYAADHTCDLSGEPRRTVQSAGWKVADAGTQKPEETADMVGVGVAEEQVADLMRHPGRHAARVPQVEQQAAAAVNHFQPQQGVAKNPVDQGGGGGADARNGYRPAVVALVERYLLHLQILS